nr:histidine kinase-like ATPase, C-terminal domain-containing protein [Tanacetum cinerariifolium]
MMITDDSDANTNKHHLDTNGTVHERLIKKPKVQVRLPEGFLILSFVRNNNRWLLLVRFLRQYEKTELGLMRRRRLRHRR